MSGHVLGCRGGGMGVLLASGAENRVHLNFLQRTRQPPDNREFSGPKSRRCRG